MCFVYNKEQFNYFFGNQFSLMMIEIIFSTPVPCDCACIKFRKILLRPVQVGLNISITANMIVASLLLFSVASVLSQVELTTYIFASCAKDIKFLIQDTPPPFTMWLIKEPFGFGGNKSCYRDLCWN